MNEILANLTPVAPTTPTTNAAPANSVSPEFRLILERLQRLAQPESAPTPAADDEHLQDALSAADLHFADAMELRRKLESAFKALQP